MKRELVFTGIIGLLVFTACVGKPKETPLLWIPSQPVKKSALSLIVDYKNKDLGEDIPTWVSFYEGYPSHHIKMVESMEEYRDRYVFVSENKGTSFNILQQWVSNFRVSQDFALMVSARIQARLTNGASYYPDYEYGAFFELAVKAAADAVYSGAIKETDSWVQKHYFKEDGFSLDREEYYFFILVSIDKMALKSQIDIILNQIKVPIPPTKDQISAINRVKENFYEGF